FPSTDPDLQTQIEKGATHIEVLSQNKLYTSLIEDIEDQLPSGQLRKWKTRGEYKSRLCRAFNAAQPKHDPIVSAHSFQEKTLRASKAAILEAYNRHIGGIEGRGIGFGEFKNPRGRQQMRHSFVN